eukprot:jgi/Mesvir1/19898/Mv13175-RA.2
MPSMSCITLPARVACPRASALNAATPDSFNQRQAWRAPFIVRRSALLRPSSPSLKLGSAFVRTGHVGHKTSSTSHSRSLTVFAAGSQLPGCRVIGVGSAVSPNVLTNADLEALVETSDEWIATRTGIRSRHIIGANEKLSDYAAESVKKALAMAGITAEELDMIIMATSTTDDAFGTACMVQDKVGAKCISFDITAACSGFVLAVVTATRFIKAGGYRNICVIGADAMSRIVDWKDRGTCILFGDGAGAVIVQAAKEGEDCLFGYSMHSDGSGHKQLLAEYTPAEALSSQLSSSVKAGKGRFCDVTMNGGEVFKFAVRAIPQVITESLESVGMTTENIDWLVCHQVGGMRHGLSATG